MSWQGSDDSSGIRGYQVQYRQGDAVYYFTGDHLGSVSLTTDSAGTVIDERRYLPYGEERWTKPNGTAMTDFTFTGQRAEKGFGLMDYNARYYSAVLGRFVSADTIVPDPSNPQSFNRYAYVYNNPVRYTDPSGHCPTCTATTPLLATGPVGVVAYIGLAVVSTAIVRANAYSNFWQKIRLDMSF